MTDHLKTIRSALEAAGVAKLADGTYLDKHCQITMALTALDALEQAMREPVAWRISDAEEPEIGWWYSEEPSDLSFQLSEPLFAAPPAQQAQPIKSICTDCRYTDSWGIPDRPHCNRCEGGQMWEPLNESSVNPNAAQQAQPTFDERLREVAKQAQAEAVPQDAKRLDWIAMHGSFGVDSVTGLPGGNGQTRKAATRAAIDTAMAAPQPKEQSNAVCRSDGKCQYAIDHDAEKLGHCPTGKCVMPRQAETALQPKGGV